MKISKLETFVVDGGWRAWTYVKVETDEGITGWGECSDTRVPNAVTGAVRDLSTVLVGQDPRAYEARFIDMARTTVAAIGGTAIDQPTCASATDDRALDRARLRRRLAERIRPAQADVKSDPDTDAHAQAGRQQQPPSPAARHAGRRHIV